MAKSKKLVMLNTPINQLDKLIGICLKDDNFEVQNAEKFISKSMGYEQYKQENPYADLFTKVSEIIQYGFDITTRVHEIDIIHDEKYQRYLQEMQDNFDKYKSERELLKTQLEQCESAISKYSHFKNLKVDLDKILNCEFISMRFGHISTQGYNKLQSVYSDNPYLMFTICSQDDTGYWGAYFAPKDKVEEIDSIFVVLNFDRLYIPAAVGKIHQIEDQLNKNIEIVKLQKEQVDQQIKALLKKESGEIVSLYFALLGLDEVYSYKRYAVRNSKDSFFVGTIPAKYEDEFIEKIKQLPDVFTNVEKYKISKKKR